MSRLLQLFVDLIQSIENVGDQLSQEGFRVGTERFGAQTGGALQNAQNSFDAASAAIRALNSSFSLILFVVALATDFQEQWFLKSKRQFLPELLSTLLLLQYLSQLRKQLG